MLLRAKSILTCATPIGMQNRRPLSSSVSFCLTRQRLYRIVVSDIRFVLDYVSFSDPTYNASHKGDCGVEDSFCGPDGWSRSTNGRNGSRGILFP